MILAGADRYHVRSMYELDDYSVAYLGNTGSPAADEAMLRSDGTPHLLAGMPTHGRQS
jgi:hypothetical protein